MSGASTALAYDDNDDEAHAALAAKTAVVVVHYGDVAPTQACLDSLAELAESAEVILVDQPPTRCGTHPVVTRRIETSTNVGFAAACNLAVAAVDAPFVLLINNDAVMDAGSTACLLRRIAALPDGAAGACLKVLDMNGRTIQSAGGLVFTRDGIGFPRGLGETDRGQYDYLPEREVGVPSGAAALFRTSAWREAGGMSEEFFCYCEDGDLGLRLLALGYTFASFPDVVVRHAMSNATGAHSLFKAFHVERNHFLAMLHTAPAALLTALPLLTLLRVARLGLDALRGRGAGGGLRNSASASALATTLLRAWAGALTMLPPARARRRSLLKHTPAATTRVGLYLRTHRASLADLARSRDPRH